MRKPSFLRVSCRNKELQELVVKAYLAKAKHSDTRDVITYQACIDGEVKLNGFRSSSKAPDSKLFPELLAQVVKAKSIHYLMASAWIESIPEIYASICDDLEKGGFEKRLLEVTRQFAEEQFSEFPHAEIVDIIEGLSESLDEKTIPDRKETALVSVFKRGFELLANSKVEDPPDSTETGEGNGDSSSDALMKVILENAKCYSPDDKALVNIRNFANELLEICDQKATQLGSEINIEASICRFYAEREDELSYISKRLGVFPSLSTVLGMPSEIQSHCLESLASMEQHLDEAMKLRGEVAEDSSALDTLQKTFASIESIKKQLESLIDSASSSKIDGNTVEINTSEPTIFLSEESGSHIEWTKGAETASSVEALEGSGDKIGYAPIVENESNVGFTKPTVMAAENDRPKPVVINTVEKVEKENAGPVESEKPIVAHLTGIATLDNSRDLAKKALGSIEPWKQFQPLLWCLLAEGCFRESWNIARLIPFAMSQEMELPDVRLLEALSLSNEVLGGVTESRYAERLDKILSSYMLDVLDSKVTVDPAQSLLVVAACLRPSFISEGLKGTSTGLLREAIRTINGGFGALRQLSLDIAEHADQHSPFDLGSAKGKKYWESALQNVRSEAREWLERAPRRNMIYNQAFNLWKEWIGKSGRISEPLKIVEADEVAEIAFVRKFIEEFSSEEAVKREVQKHQSLRKQPDIKSNALRHLYEHSLAGMRIARKWIELKESMALRKDSFRTRKSEELISKLKNSCPPAIQEIAMFSSGSYEEVAASRACGVMVTSIISLVDPNVDQDANEPKFDWYVSEVGYHLPSVQPDIEWNTAESKKLATNVFEVVRDHDWSVAHAFKIRLSELDFGAVDAIIEHVRGGETGSKEIVEFEKQRNLKLQEASDLLRKKLSLVQGQVEEAVSNNVLKEAERSDFVSRIDSISDQSEKGRLLDYRKAFDRLEGISKAVKELVVRQRNEVVARIDRIADLSDPTWKRLHELVDLSDFVTVEDYIGKLRSGEPLPDSEPDTVDPASRFLEKAEIIERDFKDPDTGKDRANYIGWFAQRIRDRKPIQGLNISKSTGASTSRFASALEEWGEIKRLRIVDAGQVEKIVKAIGFIAIKKIEKITSQQNLAWFRMTSEPILDRGQCQSPIFGSLAKGCYRLLCVYEGYEESQILDLVGETINREPVIVLFFRRLAPLRRRNLASLCVEKRRSFIVVDELLLLTLADSESPLRSLFTCALPFSFGEPYMPTSSIVPRELFFGRKYELESIMDHRGSSFIYGGRQLGKTVLLREAERRANDPANGKIAVWIDLKNYRIGYDRALEELWSIIGSELSKYEIIPKKETHNLRPEKLKQRIMDWLDADRSRSILLLLDEADMFLEKDGGREEDGKGHFAYASVLKGFMDSSERRLKLVFAGLHNVQRMTKLANHPLAHLGEPLCIGPLIDRDEGKEAEALIRAPLESIGYTISQDLIYRILALTNYYPSLIQLFCQELLKHLGSRVKELFSPRETPPRVISSRHVEEAYRSENLRKAIRDRFYWTLQLDQRYEVIAYAMAYEYLSDLNSDPPLEMSVAKIRDCCVGWWKEGFIESSHEEMRALVDEMVGLGILRQAAGRYAFRNSNILRLLGTQDEIADLLAQDRDPPLEFAPMHMRDIRLATGKFSISPLTTSQEASLRHASDDVRIVLLPPMVSTESLDNFLTKIYGKKIMWGINSLFVGEVADFGKRLKAKMAGAEAGTYAIVYESTEPWTVKHVREAISVIRRKTSIASNFHVLFIADPQQAWQVFQDDNQLYDALMASDEQFMSLGHMHDESMRYWLEEQSEYSLSRSNEHRIRLTEKTGGWPVLVEHFHKIFIDVGKDFEKALQRFDATWSEKPVMPLVSGFIGTLGNDIRAKVLFALFENSKFEEYSEGELLKSLDDMEKFEAGKALEWARSLGYVQKIGENEWRIDPIISKIFASRQNA
jgi:hypothetical protein